MDIYIKPKKKNNLTGRKQVVVKDIADVFAKDGFDKKIEQVAVYQIQENKEKSYLISILDVVKAIEKQFPGHTIHNMGEIDTVVQYAPAKKKQLKIVEWGKVFFVCLVLLTGSSSAIMSFQTEAQLPTIFKDYHYIFFGERVEKPYIITIPYSIGLAVGIVVFFNHFGRFKISKDPTPIEVELALYESDTTDTIIDALSHMKDEEKTNKNKEE